MVGCVDPHAGVGLVQSKGSSLVLDSASKLGFLPS